MNILVCNAGSSSLKFSLFEAERELVLAEGGIDWTTTPTGLVIRFQGQPQVRTELRLRQHADAVAHILGELQAGRQRRCTDPATSTPLAIASCTVGRITPPPCGSRPRSGR